MIILLLASSLAPISILLISTQSQPVAASPGWWDEDWPYRAPITLTVHPDNYQIRIVLDKVDNLGSHCLDNFQDVRFTENDDGPELSFWIENYISGDNAVFFVRRVENDVPGDNQIYVYYGNSGATSASNYDNTMTKDFGEDNLKLLFHMDEGSGTTVYDDPSAGGDDNGTFGNDPDWVGSDGGQWDNQNVTFSTGDSINFDGTDEYVSVNDSSSLDITGEITLEMWFKLDVLKNYNFLISKGNDSAEAFEIFVTSDGGLNGDWKFTTGRTGGTVGTVVAGSWYHLVWTFVKDVGHEVYLNGALSGTFDVTGDMTTNAQPLYIGVEQLLSARFTDGIIDEVRIYDRALSAEEASAHYERRKFYTPEPTATVGAEETAAAWNLIESWTGDVLGIQPYFGYRENGLYSKNIKYSAEEIIPTVENICGQEEGYENSKAVDNDFGTYWWHDTDENHWIILDLGDSRTVTNVSIYTTAQLNWGANVGMVVYVSENTVDWGDNVWDGQLKKGGGTGWRSTDTFSELGRYVRLVNKAESSNEELVDVKIGVTTPPDERILGSVFTVESEGIAVADSIVAYFSTDRDGYAKAAIYKHSDDSLVGEADEFNFQDEIDAGWWTFDFSESTAALSPGENYVLALWGDVNIYFSYDDDGDTQGLLDGEDYDSSFPDPASFALDGTKKYSIYCTYTLSDWDLIETWMGTADGIVGWELVESWSSTVQAPSPYVTTNPATGVGYENVTLNATVSLAHLDNVDIQFLYKGENQCYYEGDNENWNLSDWEYTPPTDPATANDWANRTLVWKIAADDSSNEDKATADIVLDYDHDENEINEALRSDNAKIFLYAGHYKIDNTGGILMWSDNKSFIGAGKENTIIEFTESVGTYSLSLLDHTDNILIENLNIVGPGRLVSGEYTGCHVAGSENTVIRNCKFENFTAIGVYVESGRHINVWVDNNEVKEMGNHGISVGMGLVDRNINTAHIINNTIINCGIGSHSYSGGNGIALFSPINTVVANNWVENSGYSGIGLHDYPTVGRSPENILVQGNKIIRTTILKNYTIQIAGLNDSYPAENITIKGNDIDAFLGVRFNNSYNDNVTIENNNFYNTVKTIHENGSYLYINNVEPNYWDNNYTTSETIATTDYSKTVENLEHPNIYGFRAIIEFDGYENRGDLLEFTTLGVGKPVLYLPENDSTIYDNTPTLEWTNGGGAAYHRLVVNDNENFLGDNEISVNVNVPDNSYTVPPANALSMGNYWWKVIAIYSGEENESETFTFELAEAVPPSIEDLYITDMENNPMGTGWFGNDSEYDSGVPMVYPMGENFVCPADVTVDNIVALVRTTGVSANTQCAIYERVGDNVIFIARTENVYVTNATFEWKTFSFTSTHTLEGGIEYVLFAWADSTDIALAEDSDAGHTQFYLNADTFDEWPENTALLLDDANEGYSIFCNYTEPPDLYRQTQYKFWVAVTDNDNLSDIENVTLVVYLDNENLPDNAVNHYTFRWTASGGFSEVGPDGHLVVENCENFDNTLTTDNIVFAIEFGENAQVTDNDNWDVWVQAYDSYGDQDNLFFLGQFDMLALPTWNLIESWTGTAQAPVAWELIEQWSCTVEAPAQWDLIETWDGIIGVRAPAEWQLVETWTGTAQAPSEWGLIETWTATVEAPSAWQLVETWTGTIEAPVAWELIESWDGTIDAPVAWIIIETWTGTVEAPVKWSLIEQWTGTVQAPSAWDLIEQWDGTITAPSEWNLIETWTGTVEAFSGWRLVEEWSSAVEAFVGWQLVESWTGGVVAPSEWTLVESWTGTIESPVEWQLIESWTGTLEAFSGWRLLETWGGTIEAFVGWHEIESWTGTVIAPVQWSLLETWNGTIEAPAQWELIETWSGTVQAPSAWSLLETWQGTITTPSEWSLVESWAGTIQTLAEWSEVESWSGGIVAVGWTLIETWEGTVQTHGWLLAETWTGGIMTPAVYAVSITITPDNQSGTLGDTLTFTVIVVNIGGTTDNYDLTASDAQGWTTYLDDDNFLNVSSGDNGTTTLNVGLTTLGTHTVTVAATGMGVSDTATCTATSLSKYTPPPGGTIGMEFVGLGVAIIAIGLVVAMMFVFKQGRGEGEE